MSDKNLSRFLHRLARLYGVQTTYYDVFRQRRQASTDSLLALLRSLGAPIVTLDDVPSAWREQQQALWRRLLEPVVIAWENMPSLAEIRLPASQADGTLRYHLKLETGKEVRGEWQGGGTSTVETAEVEGTEYVVKQFPLPDRLPPGYHELSLEMPVRQESSLIIVSPLRAYTPGKRADDRSWGVFLPLYALRSEGNWGSGDFADLEQLLSWLGDMRGRIMATLPLLATFLDGDAHPSPYLPCSRLLWNEFYLDVSRVPELSECPLAQELISAPQFQEEMKALRDSPLVDYRRQMALKREALEELTHCLFKQASRRLDDLRRFSEAQPVVEDYARFRATVERQHRPWRSWRQPLKDGTIKEGDYDEANRRYHLYVQWLAHQQLENVSETAREKGIQLYLDLPLGVHPDGYDVWRERGSFLPDVSTGAPPDTVFTRGQNWGFPPLHPQKIREQGYRYTIASLRHHLNHAGILRIDHVMGFHRLFCIPDGMDGSQGIYLRYHPEELYAILALESQRSQTIIAGEDLGIVPGYVRPTMRKHGLQRMYVLRYELASDIQQGVHPVPADSIASLNTHDMPPFASFWQGLDVEERLGLGILDEPSARQERENLPRVREVLATLLKKQGWLREPADVLAVIHACLSFLAASRGRLVLINLEDLWLETRPQNVPSTKAEYPNWRHKARHALEEFCQMPQVADILRAVARLRRPGG